MIGKPWIVAVLAALVVAMVGLVFLQQAPEGFIVSGMLRIADGEAERLEALLQQEAAAELAHEKDKPIDPASIAMVKSNDQKEMAGTDVGIQAEGKKSQSALDYLNNLMVRYTRRESRADEMAQTKLEISEAERKLEAALLEKEAAAGKIDATEKEIHQLLEREKVEAERIAKHQPAPEPKRFRPSIEEMAEPALPDTEEAPALPSEPAEKETAKEEPEQAPEPSLSDAERADLEEELKILKTERMKLISGGRKKTHPKVEELDRQIREIEARLATPAKPNGPLRKASYQSEGDFTELALLGSQRNKLEQELEILRNAELAASEIESAQKEKLAELVARHEALDSAFKPVILAPAKVISERRAAFPFFRLLSLTSGALIAGAIAYLLAKWNDEPRVLTSISEAESILKMPVRKLAKSTVRRRAA